MRFLDSLTGPRWTVGLFLLLATLWGTSFVAIEIGLHTFPPLYFAGVRYLFAGVIIMAYAMSTNPQWLPRSRPDWITIAVFSVFIIFGNHAFLYLGEQSVSGAVAAIIISLTPVLTVMLASLFLGHGTPRLHEIIGFLLGIGGVVVIAQPDPSGLDMQTLVGIGLVFLAAVSFAVGGVLSRPFRTGLPVETVQGWSMVLGSLLLLGGGHIRGESVAGLSVSPTAGLSLVYLTLFSGVVAFMIYFTLLDRVGPTQLNLVGYLEPVAASLMGWVLLGQVIAMDSILGFAMITLGFVFIQRDLLITLIDETLPGVGAILHRVSHTVEKVPARLRDIYGIPPSQGRP